MGRAQRLLACLGVGALGYAAAVMAAVVATETLILAPSALPDAGRWGSIVSNLRDLPTMFWGGMLITGFWGLPGFLIAIVLARLNRWRSWRVFALLGGANGAFSLGLCFSYTLTSIATMQASLLMACVVGGCAGGAAYWLVVESQGVWRRMSLPA